MNNFYFQGHGIADFAGEFCKRGGRVLLIDQVFKQPDWSKELRRCYDEFPYLKIVFTGSSVMRLKDENPELNGIVKSYNLRGFSFREFITFCVGSLSDALRMSASQVYGALRSSGVLNDYIVPCYDVLHTFSKDYLVEELTEVLKERGALA